jgi:hypothetical protein
MRPIISDHRGGLANDWYREFGYALLRLDAAGSRIGTGGLKWIN